MAPRFGDVIVVPFPSGLIATTEGRVEPGYHRLEVLLFPFSLPLHLTQFLFITAPPTLLLRRLLPFGLATGFVRLIRDRDRIYGSVFNARVNNLGIRQLETAPRSPWQNGYAERFAGTLRREILDHVIVLGERHLLRLVRLHAAYYNEDRPHMALERTTAGLSWQRWPIP